MSVSDDAFVCRVACGALVSSVVALATVASARGHSGRARGFAVAAAAIAVSGAAMSAFLGRPPPYGDTAKLCTLLLVEAVVLGADTVAAIAALVGAASEIELPAEAE